MRGAEQDTCHRLLSITNEAHQHGVRAQEMWKLVKQRTTRAQFGKALRRLLLSGTEWVQSLSAKSAAEKKAAEEKGNGGSVLSNSRTKSVEADPKEMAAMRKHSTHSNATELDKKEGEGGEAASGDRTDAEAIGHQFWEFITVVLDLLWEPERQNEQLILVGGDAVRGTEAAVCARVRVGWGSAFDGDARGHSRVRVCLHAPND